MSRPVAMRRPQRSASKYRNTKCTVDGQAYRSKREAQRHRSLLVMQRSGLIADLQREVPFVLAPSVRYMDKRATPALRYFADFVYTQDGQRIVEDCKGLRTEGYRIKRHLMLALHGIEILET